MESCPKRFLQKILLACNVVATGALADGGAVWAGRGGEMGTR